MKSFARRPEEDTAATDSTSPRPLTQDHHVADGLVLQLRADRLPAHAECVKDLLADGWRQELLQGRGALRQLARPQTDKPVDRKNLTKSLSC